MERVISLTAVLLVGFCGVAAGPVPERVLTHTYGSGPSAIVVSLVDILPNGPVRIAVSSPRAHVRHGVSVSHEQFERMWTTLRAYGAPQLVPAYAGKEADRVNNYLFSLGEVAIDQGAPVIGAKQLTISVSGAPPGVADLARQMRDLVTEDAKSPKRP